MKFICSILKSSKTIGLLFFTFSSLSLAQQSGVLGKHPLCEASAAISLPCPDSSENCLLVGDNEYKEGLFQFEIQNEKLLSSKQHELNYKSAYKLKLKDLEAITALDSGELLIFGSQSRNSSCKKKKNRKWIATAEASSEEILVTNVSKTIKLNCKKLFGEHSASSPLVSAACARIDEAEKIASGISNDVEDKSKAKQLCNEVQAYNAEGAVNIGNNNIWVGLRAPLLPTHPENADKSNLAMLFHMVDPTAYKFDQVASIDLTGHGIRELTLYKNDVWIISGPANDSSEAFKLWRFPHSNLVANAIIQPKLVTELPTSSEGLAIVEDKAYIVIDGDSEETFCEKNSQYLTLDI